jgi:hypothetical protein
MRRGVARGCAGAVATSWVICGISWAVSASASYNQELLTLFVSAALAFSVLAALVLLVAGRLRPIVDFGAMVISSLLAVVSILWLAVVPGLGG